MIQTAKRQPTGLSTTEREALDERGWVVRKGLAGPELMRRIHEETQALHEQMAANPAQGVGISWEELPEDKPKRIRQLMHSEVVCPSLAAFVRGDAVLDIVESVLGPDITLFHSKLLMKAARDGTVTPWHQDYGYWKTPYNRPVYLNCMLAIDPFTKENGCTQFVPGSHKGGLQEHERKPNVSFNTFLPGFFQPRPEAAHVEMEPGDCVFFGPLVIHGSEGNTSEHSRRANTAAYVVTGNDDIKWCRGILRGKANA